MAATIFPTPLSGIQETKLTTTGDTLYASAANTAARLGIGTTGQVLTVAAGLPSWATASAGAAVKGATLTTGSNKSTTSTSYVAIDSTNLRITMSPAGTTAYWITEGFLSNSGVSISDWRVNAGAGTVHGFTAYNSSYESTAVPKVLCMGVITGLTAGTSYNFDWEWKVNAGTTTLIGDTATVYPRMTVIC